MGLPTPTNENEITRLFNAADGALARKEYKVLKSQANALYTLQTLTDAQRAKLVEYFRTLSEHAAHQRNANVYNQPPPRYASPRGPRKKTGPAEESASGEMPDDELSSDAQSETLVLKKATSARIGKLLSGMGGAITSYAEQIMDTIPTLAAIAREDRVSHADLKFTILTFCVQKRIEDQKRAMILDALAASMT